MLVLAIFYFLYVTYCAILLLIDCCKTRTCKPADLIDLFCDFCRSILLLLAGLAVEMIIEYNWFLFCIPLCLDIAGRIFLKKMAAKKASNNT